MGSGSFQKKWEILPLDVIGVLYKLYIKKLKCPVCEAKLKAGMVNKKWSSKGFTDIADLSATWSPLGIDFDVTKVGLKCTQNEEHQYWSGDL
jgi:hypothetical protein